MELRGQTPNFEVVLRSNLESAPRILHRGLDARRARYVPSPANFVLIEVGDGAKCRMRETGTYGSVVGPTW